MQAVYRTQRHRGTEQRTLIPSFAAPPCLRVPIYALAATAALMSVLLDGTAFAAEIDPIKIALLVDGMASRGSGFDAGPLHALGTDGLAAVLDHLLPDTAPPTPPMQPQEPEAVIRRLIARLDADDFNAREQATQELIVRARGRRQLIEEAAQSDSLEVRLRAERVLASWESRPGSRLSAYLSGFWSYVEGLSDPPRLELLASRTIKAFEQGMPEGDRLHLLRLCIAGVAHGRDNASCDILRPLIQHQDVRIAMLVTETVGAYKTEPRFVPQLLVDALASRRQPVVEAALRFVLGCQDENRREAVRTALCMVFEKRDESLKFQACLPLIRDFYDAGAWAYVLEQTTSKDANRVRTAFNWIGDTKNCGQPPEAQLMKRLDPFLASDVADQRRAAVQAVGTFSGTDVVGRLIARLSDADDNVARQAAAALLAQPDRKLVQRLVEEAAAKHSDIVAQSRAKSLLTKTRE
jgi:hypothetical protein